MTTMFFWLALTACFDGAESDDDTAVAEDGGGLDGGDVDGGSSGDTGDGGIPFETIASSDAKPPCGPREATELMCGADDLVVLSAADDDTFAALFKEHIRLTPPALELDGKIALLSYLPFCPYYEERLEVDHVDLDGTVLRVDELFLTAANPGAVVGCIYNVVTIPETDFTDIATTLTVVPPEE